VLTLVGPVIFFGLVFLLVVGSARIDRAFGLPWLLPGLPGTTIGVTLLAAGMMLWIWCVAWFIRAGGGGTPVPFNPPHELVTLGPYAWTRNPMLTGVFSFIFGIGFIFHSMSMVFVWTPIFVIVNVVELKLVEEPELERRFGARYREYRGRVPMFVPKPPAEKGKGQVA
jgi:protein-S-isoprenylcysteine O-methyltransferase Ste14